MSKNRYHPQRPSTPPPSQQPPRAPAATATAKEPTKQTTGPLEAALTATADAIQAYDAFRTEHAASGNSPEPTPAPPALPHKPDALLFTLEEMIEHLESRGYQVIKPVQVLDDGAKALSLMGKSTIPFNPTELEEKFSNLKFDKPDEFRSARQLGNGNIMAHVQVPEAYAEGVLSESENQSVTPGDFLDARLQEVLENYFVGITRG